MDGLIEEREVLNMVLGHDDEGPIQLFPVGEPVEVDVERRKYGDCIVPWLSIRNTCPVCRYELPTDDPQYEQRRNRRTGGL